ncbi:putative bifunctional diguanylate cyclase/phosphodiesterase [Allosphingosinicella flava]|nr:EAL domain-containing protein [Sphingosinicella flava]
MLPTAAVVLLVALLVGGVLFLSTNRVDALATERQMKLASLVLDQAMTSTAHDQEASTYWDDAVVNVTAPNPDLDWLDNNLGIWFHTYYGHDEAYILNARNMPIYAMRAGRRTQPDDFARVSTQAQRMVGGLRELMRSGWDDAVAPGSQTPGMIDVGIVNGHPAIISVKPILSETGAVPQRQGAEFLHVSIRYLDGNLLQEMEREYWFSGAQFRWRPAEDAGYVSHAIRTRSGQVIGYFCWRPFTPGAEVATTMLLVLGAGLALIAMLAGWLLLRIRRSTLELQASEAQAQHLAFHDALTGLPNRALFNDRLDIALGRARRGEEVALLLLDLDRFKHVNDTLGHQAGDALIREFSGRLAQLLREHDTVARLGGDEFGIVLSGIDSDWNVASLCERILDAVRKPFDVVGSEVYVGVSIGVAMAPADGTERGDLLRKADIALYRAKGEGRDCYRIFTRDMDESVRMRGSIEEDLRSALATGKGLYVAYQPQVAGRRIVGVEALIRWQHPERGLITPEQFIGVAEETGLIGRLGEWVLEQACLASLLWPKIYVAVNLSAVQFRAADFADRVLAIVRETGAVPQHIQLEITEGVLLGEDAMVIDALRKLRAAGLKIALDDFGTGYSSLRYLRRFEVDKIKIDRSFVKHLGHAADSAAIVSAVVNLGHAMGLTVTAEGVETDDQRRFLAKAGCNEMQGFFFSQALSEGDVAKLLKSRGGPRGKIKAAA